jgi:hypothetical protein
MTRNSMRACRGVGMHPMRRIIAATALMLGGRVAWR